jgi:hypothetical protein
MRRRVIVLKLRRRARALLVVIVGTGALSIAAPATYLTATAAPPAQVSSQLLADGPETGDDTPWG